MTASEPPDLLPPTVPNPELGPDGKEWAKTVAGFAHVDTMIPRADTPYPFPAWHGWALREAFVAGAEWQQSRPPPPAPETGEVETNWREVMATLVLHVQEWCDAVERDSSWDGWDYHYKNFAYNGGLDAARAILAPKSDAAPTEGGEK